ELIGKKNDLSENILDSNFMLGMLQGYLFTLERLAVTKLDSERKEYEEKKHYYEGILSPKKKIGNVGREGVLRSCILTAAILREKAPKDQDQGRRFRKVYEQLVKLSKLSEFSKNKTGIRKAVGYGKTANTDADITSKINNLTASFNVEAPYVGTVTASASRKTIKGSPFIYENGKFMRLTVSLPIYSSGVVGLAVVRERFKSVFDKASDKKLSINLDDFKDIAKGFGIVKGVDKAAAVLSNLGSPAGISASGSADFTFNWRCTPHLKDSSKLIPLPGEKLIKNDKDRWSLDSVVVLKKINAGINTSGKIVDVPVSVKASASIGKQSKIVGSDTFNDTLGKANVFALGIVDSKSGESTQMSSMLKKRSKQFVKMFKRIASMDSNAAIELQDAYNKIMNHCDSSEEKTECEQLFRDFIAGCKKLAKNGTENGDANSGEEETAELLDEEDAGKKNELKSLDTKEIKQTLDLFGKILNKYYIHVFKPFYDQSFSVVNEEENTEEEDYLPNQNIAESK
ncbi:MAG: hypothetical protein IJ730_04595, partial [Alphaproteobacteria bacterium]|nr:hypothetical protein [Alphaproteobacteria bacterium]